MSEAISHEIVDILLVEDNPGDVRLTVEVLKLGKVRNRLAVVSDGVEALDYLHRGANSARRFVPISSCSILICLKKTDERCWPSSRVTLN